MPPELIALAASRRRLGHCPDAELFLRVATGSETDRQHAQAELYSRHVQYLYAVLLRQQQRLSRVVGISAEDLVQDTFHRAFQRAATFSASDSEDPEQLRRRTRAWLGRIAQNLLFDALRNSREVTDARALEAQAIEPEEPSPASGSGASSASGEGHQNLPETERTEPVAPASDRERLSRAFHALSDREQDVLRVSAMYYLAGEHQRLPNAVSAELAQRWSTTSENIRAVRSRALKKLKLVAAATHEAK